MKHVLITTTPLGQGRVTIGTVQGPNWTPIEMCFTGSWLHALKERNQRFERWCQEADTVSAERMPVQF